MKQLIESLKENYEALENIKKESINQDLSLEKLDYYYNQQELLKSEMLTAVNKIKELIK